MLQALDVSLRLGGKSILQAVSLSLQAGELLAVLGPNGAGKSTLLRVLTGALMPQVGLAALDDRPLQTWNGRELARRRAVLPQSSPLAFGFRAFEVVLLGREPHSGLSAREEDLEIAEAAMREADVIHLAERSYATLSGGEQQRVQLARVLSQVWPGGRDPSLRFLLLDEPTSSLDLAHQHAILRLARGWSRAGAGVLAVLHDLNLAAMYADRVCILKAGRQEAEGKPEAVFTAGTIKACFDLEVVVSRHPLRDCPYILPS